MGFKPKLDNFMMDLEKWGDGWDSIELCHNSFISVDTQYKDLHMIINEQGVGIAE